MDMDMMLHTMTHPMVQLRTLLDAIKCRDVGMSLGDQYFAALDKHLLPNLWI